MKYLITGGNGYIGSHLTSLLLEEGHQVRILAYPGTDISQLRNTEVELLVGDIRNVFTMEKAVTDCDGVYHLASCVGLWQKDKNLFHDVNVIGTKILLEACHAEGVKRVLICSSCGVFGPSENGCPVDETQNNFHRLGDPYELSKYQQVVEARKYLNQMEIVFVYPTRVFGPGIQSEGSSFTGIIQKVIEGRWHIIPGNGKAIGNYVFVDDVVEAFKLAMEKGESGIDYILGGENASYDELFDLLKSIAGTQHKLTHVPDLLMKVFGFVSETLAEITGKKPFLTKYGARKYTSDWIVSTQKIRKELGFQPHSLKQGLARTINHFISEKQKKLESEEENYSSELSGILSALGR